MATQMSSLHQNDTKKIALIGAGTIGLSFAALHLSAAILPPSRVIIYDPRPDLRQYIEANLPGTSTFKFHSSPHHFAALIG